MAGYFDDMTPAQRTRIMQVAAALHSAGIKNKFLAAAILAVVSKESNFMPVAEGSYANTSAERIRTVFPSYFGSSSDAEINRIKADPVAFFNRVYGGKYGNSATEGFKYRGRGLNQLTFKGNYKHFGKLTGLDLVGNPDLLLQMGPAAKVCAAYFIDNLKKAPATYKAKYHFTDLNDFRTLKDACMAAYHANAGWGKSSAQIIADATGGLGKTLSRAPGFLKMLEGGKATSSSSGGRNGLAIAAGVLLLGIVITRIV